MTELDLRLVDWASAELKSVAADFLSKDLRPCEHWSTSTSRPAKRVWSGSWQRFCAQPLDSDLLDSITTFERKIMIYEAQSRETISDSLNIGCVIAGLGQNRMREHLLMSATKIRQLDKFRSRDWIN